MMSGDDFSRDEEETTVTVDIDALNTAYSSINNDIFLWFSKKKNHNENCGTLCGLSAYPLYMNYCITVVYFELFKKND